MPLTFDTRGGAEAWLTLRHSEILRNEWLPPAAPKAVPVTLDRYADAWLESRGLEDTTREHYKQLLRDHIYPTFGDCPVSGIEPAAVRTWHAETGKCTGLTARAHAYALLRTVLGHRAGRRCAHADRCPAAGPADRAGRVVRPVTRTMVRGAGQRENVPVADLGVPWSDAMLESMVGTK